MKYSKAAQLSAFLTAALVSAVVVPTAMYVLANNHASNLEQAQGQKAFSSSDYTYEDAVALASFWGETVDETKTTMGHKISWGDESVAILNNSLKEARQEAQINGKDNNPQTEQSTRGNDDKTTQTEKEAFLSSDYTYEDAVALAGFWGKSLDETKARMGRKILWGDENVAILNDYLEAAGLFHSK